MTKTKAKREPTYLLDCVLPPTDVTADGFLAKHSLLPLRIHVRGDLNIGVSELRLRQLHIPGFFVDQRGRGVAEHMKAAAPAMPGATSFRFAS
jgi:hypothetical protein